MGELRKPYEISIWEDRLEGEGEKRYYKEAKLAVIGSDKMTSPNRAYNPIFHENINGEKTLTFTITYKYYDELQGELVENPFYAYLINERKVKLHYNDEWYEFVIKECEENSENYEFTYTAKELFSLELSKVGYNIELDQSLNNNQGTVTELGWKAIEGTDWVIDEENSDTLRQYVQEPLYQCKARKAIDVINLDTQEPFTISSEEIVYIFYSYLKNQIKENVQLIRQNDNPSEHLDDDGVIKLTNYRLVNPVTYTVVDDKVTGIDEFDILGIYSSNQGYRLVYKQQTTYDPVMERTVDLYKAQYEDGEQEIYHYTDYDYTSSTIVTSYMTNGYNFNVFDNGTLQGWDNATTVSHQDHVTLFKDFIGDGEGKEFELPAEPESGRPFEITINGTTAAASTYTLSGKKITFNTAPAKGAKILVKYQVSGAGKAPILQPMHLVTYPDISSSGDLTLIKNFSEISGYLEMKFNGTLGNGYDNAYFNSGFNDNMMTIDHIAKGEKFALRLRYMVSDTKHGDLVIDDPTSNTNKGIRVLVAKYETVEREYFLNENAFIKENGTPSKVKAYKIIPSEVILDFNGAFQKSENIIKDGIFNDNHDRYIIDNVIQVPSTLYCYQDKRGGDLYVWDPKNAKFILKDNSYADYYITSAAANYSYSNERMQDPNFKLGVFVYTNDSSLVDKFIYLQDIQLTRYYEYTEGNTKKPVIMGNVPVAQSIPVEYFYLKPNTGAKKESISTYGSTESLALDLGIDPSLITPVYNKNCEKVLSIQESHSNCFNILQSICETFECWLKIRVPHNEDGSIVLDKDNNPIKKIAFKEYAGKDNFAGFKKGINLDSITRNIDSNEIVTKMIVEPVTSEFSDNGSIDIGVASSNPSGQSHILNFSYYENRGLIGDLAAYKEDLMNYYSQLFDLNKKIRAADKEYTDASAALLKLKSNQTVFTSLIDEANQKYNDAIQDFHEITGYDYEEYVNKYKTIEEWAEDANYDLTKNDTVVDKIADIYVSTAATNNYSGILTNVNTEYHQKDLELNGAKEYTVTVSTIPPVEGQVETYTTQVTFDDYVSGVSFILVAEGGGYVTYQTTPNDRVFEIVSAIKYKGIKFIGLPQNYELKYFEGGRGIIEGNYYAHEFEIVDNVSNKPYSRHFKIQPTKEYAEQYPGKLKESEKLREDKLKLEKDFYKKYSRFIQEGTWSSQDYIDPELYYQDALQVSRTSSQPKVSYTFNVIDVVEQPNLSGYDFRVGDKTFIEDVDFFGYVHFLLSDNKWHRTPVREEVVVSEVEWHLDEPDTNVVTIQNYKTQFEDLFQRISASVQTAQFNEVTYPKTSQILDLNGLINTSLLTNSLSAVGIPGAALTTNGSVRATEDGLLIRDLVNGANVVKLASSGIQLSTDGGQSWTTAIAANGISADKLTAGTINTQNIWLMDGDNPSFRWDKAGLNAYGLNADGDAAYDLRTYVRFDKYGLYGIKNDEDFVASSLTDVRDKGFFGITWDGFFIKNSYTDGEVSITSDDDFVVKQNNKNRIKIGAVEKDGSGAPTKYGINIFNDDGELVFDTGDDGNVTITGRINALAGEFGGYVTVGDSNSTHIAIDGSTDNPTISSSNYTPNGQTGWIIDSNGDATFSNVSVRGAIKTAVFEYEEIQAVGGIFLFRPSSTIKTATYTPYYKEVQVPSEDGSVETELVETYINESTTPPTYADLIVTVETPLQFRLNDWCKISNYNSEPSAAINDGGLSHIYKISEISGGSTDPETGETTPTQIHLAGATKLLDDVPIEEIVGGALISFGNYDDVDEQVLSNNYGIGVNSSDNFVNLPARAISLFETTINPNNTIKVSYNYRGILGTLPPRRSLNVDDTIYQHMANTQGIYTDNMYIGDDNQYVAFYTEGNNKKLKIKASELMFEVGTDPQTQEPVYKDVNEIESGTTVTVYSTMGGDFTQENDSGIIFAVVTQGEQQLNEMPLRVNFGEGLPTTASPGEYFVQVAKLSLSDDRKQAILYKNTASQSGTPTWEEVVDTFKYTWTFYDAEGEEITSGAPYQEDSSGDKTRNKCIYVDTNLVTEKMVANVKVEIPE